MAGRHCVARRRTIKLKNIRVLVEIGKGIRSKDFDGRAPLRIAAYMNASSAVRALLELRASSNAKDNDGLTPLEGAVARDAKEAIRLLRE